MTIILIFVFNLDKLHPKLNCHYKALSNKGKKDEKNKRVPESSCLEKETLNIDIIHLGMVAGRPNDKLNFSWNIRVFQTHKHKNNKIKKNVNALDF